MDMEALVAIVVEEVRRILEERAASSRRLLVVMTGTPAHEAEIRAELARLRDSGRFQPTLLLSRTAAGRWDRSGLKQALGCTSSLDEESAPTPPELVFQHDVVLVPWLTMNTANKLALGICDNLVTSTLTMALLKGLPVVACAEQADPDSEVFKGWSHPAPALAAMMRDRLATLRSFGVTLVGHSELADALLNPHRPVHGAVAPVPAAAPVAAPATAQAAPAAAPAVAAAHGKRPLVTEADVRAALATGTLASLPADGIFTPLAKELLRLHGHG